MAPFNFKKKLINKEKKSPSSNSTSPSLTSTPSKDTSGSPFQAYMQQPQHQNQHQQQQHPSSQTQKQGLHHQHQHQPQHQSYPQQQQQPPSRVHPTPPPAQQRNVSGASTALPPNRREYTPWNRIKLQNSPFPRYRHVASTHLSDDGNIYVIGGLHDESVYGDTWIISSSENGTLFNAKTVDISDATPPPRVGHAATLCGNAFVLFGGDTHKVNSEGLMDDDLYLFNVNSYKWTIPHPIGPRPLGRYGHKISIIATNQMKTKLYLFGGQFDDTYFNDLAVYDLSSFRRPDSHWEFLKPKTFVPPPLTNHTMVSYDYKLWVFGGDTLQGLINQVFMYDTSSNDWSLVETSGTKPPPLQEHAGLVYKDLMCVIGGKDDQDVYMNSVYFLNLKSLKWFKFPLFKAGIPQGRSGHSVTLIQNDKILVMGGDKFDYARQGEYDLNTSDSDMGKGTILYTLDLSRLAELCPGVFDISDPLTPFNPVTPPINHAGKIPNRFNQPEPILTPYANEAMQTPTISRTFQGSLETPESKVIESEDLSEHLKAHPKTNEPSVGEIKKPVSPIPVLIHQETEPVTQAPRVVSISSEKTSTAQGNTTEEEVGVATIVSSPFKGDIKYDTLDSTLLGVNGDSQQNNLKKPVEIIKSSDLNVAESERSIPLHKTEPTEDNSAHHSKETVNADVVNRLRSELEELKLETERKAEHATEYINQLEKDLSKFLDGIPSDPHDADVMRIQMRYENLYYDTNTMERRIFELETLLNTRFADADLLNKVIKEQSLRIEELERDPSFKEELEEIQIKYESAIKENDSLKTKLKEFRLGFKNDVSNCSRQLDKLISQWEEDSEIHLKEIGGKPEADGVATKYYFGNNSLHQNAVESMQRTLDNVLEEYKDLKETNKKISSDYEELKSSHDTLTKDFQVKQTELENNYNETVNSSTNTSRALEISQMELQKFKQSNKKLQDELEELKYSHDSSNGDLSTNSVNATTNSNSNNTNGAQDLTVKFNRYNMKINDLKAELYIMGQERDNLKKELLELKKKQLNLGDQ